MNKLFLLCLLSIMILFTQSAPCSTDIPADKESDADKAAFCTTLDASANKVCQLKDDKSGCEEKPKPTTTTTTTTTTNSGNILNSFKITFALIIIFAIL